jgi:hypothetical protein
MTIFEDPIKEGVRQHLLTKTISPISKEGCKHALKTLIHLNTWQPTWTIYLSHSLIPPLATPDDLCFCADCRTIEPRTLAATTIGPITVHMDYGFYHIL